jgi:hypothetical protein
LNDVKMRDAGGGAGETPNLRTAVAVIQANFAHF